LASTRLVSLVAVVSLGLGLGATTATFSLINAVLLRPLPVAQPDRLATVSSDWAINLGFKAGAGFNYGMWERFREHAALFEDAFAWRPTRFNLGRAGESQLVDGCYASGHMFSTLGVTAIQGRVFNADDDRRGGGPAGPVAVISHGLW